MIRLESIKIEWFRGIRTGEMTELTDVNVLIGRNNCGKSTVAEAITRACGSFSGPNNDPIGRQTTHLWDQTRREASHDVRSQPELWYRQDRSKDVQITPKIDNVGQELRIHYRISSGGPVAPSLDFTDAASEEQKGVLIRFTNAVTVFLPADSSNQSIEKKLWRDLLSSRADKMLAESLNDIFGLGVEQLQLPPDGRMLLLYPDHGLSLDVQGDGTRAALRCLIMLAALQGTLMIIEEPESHQHPASLSRFAKALCKQAKAQDVQLLITTQSIESIRAFLEASEEAKSECAVFYLKLDDGVLESRRLDAETIETIQNTGLDVRCLDLYV